MKKIISAFLCAFLMASSLIINATALELPESEHNYQDNFYGEWEYSYPEQVDGLFVYFSEDTKTEDEDWHNILFGTPDEVTLSELIEYGSYYKIGDYISIFDENDNLIDFFQGDSLSGEIIYVPGSGVKITLTTDNSINDYGFKVEKITTEIPEGMTVYNCHYDNGDTQSIATDESTLWYSLEKNAYKIVDGEAVIGWKYNGVDYIYNRNREVSLHPETDTKVVDLYAITTPVQLNPEDIYSFTNRSNYFDVDDSGAYYMTKENYIRLVTSACVAHGVGPLALVGAATSAVLMTYKDWNWNGSCIGFTSTVCLQKKGILDVVGTQDGATCMRDLKPTPELVSLINYYNGQSFTSLLLKNKAFVKYPDEYSRQLKLMYESAQQGNLVLFEFFWGETPLDGYHGYAISGAYTDDNGNHILLYYDDNYGNYATQGICRSMAIAPDYSSIDGIPRASMGFVWTDEFEGYKSLDINKTIGNPFIYRFELIKHFFETLIDFFRVYVLGIF